MRDIQIVCVLGHDIDENDIIIPLDLDYLIRLDSLPAIFSGIESVCVSTLWPSAVNIVFESESEREKTCTLIINRAAQ